MFLSLTINRTTVEVNGGRIWIETPTRQVYAARRSWGAWCPLPEELPGGSWAHEGFGWSIISTPRE